jgi:glycyl-radical enzyme activating protein
MTSGWVFDCKRFSLHDGQGLRSTLFLKGCPLRCPWCHNPEGMAPGQRLSHTAARCIGCGTCLRACPELALSAGDSERDVRIDHTRCNKCGRCIDACPTGAMAFDARELSSEQAIAELLQDQTFFEVSSGGVTLSGGEPLLQPEFAVEVLDGCRRKGVGTAIETCLAAPIRHVEAMARVTDEVFVDLKLSDEDQHRELLGWSLPPIVQNLHYLVRSGANVVVRIPLIPGFTATESNLQGVGRIVAVLQPQPPVELLNFNPFAEAKYRGLGRRWAFPEDSRRYSPGELAAFRQALRSAGVKRVLDDQEEPG